MGTQTRAAEALERKIEKHIKEHADDMKNLKTEIQSLKIMKPKTQKDHRPFNDNKRVITNAKNENYRKMSAKPLKNPQNDSKATTSTTATTLNNFGDKMTNKMDLLNHHHQQQHHPNDDEHLKANNGLYQTESLCTLDSYNNTVMSLPESVMTKINYNGSVMPSPVSPIKLLQFLIMELKTKLKDYVAEDDVQIPKILNEINYAIKHVMLERKLNKSKTSQMMDINQISNDKNFTSKDTQTDLKGDDVEKLVDFQDKYFTLQAEMDVNLRRMEDVFTVELKKSDDKITKLRDDINVMQTSFSHGIEDKNHSISHHIDLKIEEIKGEMKFLIGMLGETKNHNLIDNLSKKLAQTQKKIDDVKIKCTETAKNCLQMHVENHLIKSHASQTKQIGCELGQIKNEVWREIQALKNVLTTAEEHDNESIAQQSSHRQRTNKMFEESHYPALSSLSSTSLSSMASGISSIYDKSDASIPSKILTKSIKSSIKSNEKKKMSKMMRECCDDKFNIKIDDKKDNDNSMADEKQNNITDA
ncbi:unnamed protein product [Chironomus riparius]|uniref:Uncharacterized protein n=1 Tax=Chironomus riparius TaxID=315576 RepID=A0A9N9RQF9_9DIPT|nr:unnamed protein product [Chironomus riparius]